MVTLQMLPVSTNSARPLGVHVDWRDPGDVADGQRGDDEAAVIGGAGDAGVELVAAGVRTTTQ